VRRDKKELARRRSSKAPIPKALGHPREGQTRAEERQTLPLNKENETVMRHTGSHKGGYVLHKTTTAGKGGGSEKKKRRKKHGKGWTLTQAGGRRSGEPLADNTLKALDRRLTGARLTWKKENFAEARNTALGGEGSRKIAPCGVTL